jgi:hypothetical protein
MRRETYARSTMMDRAPVWLQVDDRRQERHELVAGVTGHALDQEKQP